MRLLNTILLFGLFEASICTADTQQSILFELENVLHTSEKMTSLVNLQEQTNVIMNYLNGDVYIGGIKESERHGYGIYYPKDERYWCPLNEEDTRDDMHCPGEFLGYGLRRDGIWKNNHLNGWGRDMWSNGDVLEGNWKNDVPHGYAVFNVSFGDLYEGSWKDGLMHGTGNYLYSKDGAAYAGMYIYGRRSGFGIQTWSSGEQVAGEWVNDILTGYARFSMSGGSVYEGYYKHGKREGYGTYTWPNGIVYEGQWQHDFRNGVGMMKYPHNGMVRRGRWANDTLYEEIDVVREVTAYSHGDYRSAMQ